MNGDLPSGKQPHNCEKPPYFWLANQRVQKNHVQVSKLLVYQRVSGVILPLIFRSIQWWYPYMIYISKYTESWYSLVKLCLTSWHHDVSDFKSLKFHHYIMISIIAFLFFWVVEVCQNPSQFGQEWLFQWSTEALLTAEQQLGFHAGSRFWSRLGNLI